MKIRVHSLNPSRDTPPIERRVVSMALSIVASRAGQPISADRVSVSMPFSLEEIASGAVSESRAASVLARNIEAELFAGEQEPHLVAPKLIRAKRGVVRPSLFGGGGGGKSPRIGQRTPAQIAGDTKLQAGQKQVDRHGVEEFAAIMASGRWKWNKMEDPITYVKNADGYLVIKEGHHRFLGAKLAGIPIPKEAFKRVPGDWVEFPWRIVEWTVRASRR